MNDLAKTIEIPSGCVEHLVDFSAAGELPELPGRRIVMSGLAWHVPGYRIDYPSPRRHDLFYLKSGSFSYEYEGRTGRLLPGEIMLLPAGGRQRFAAEEPSESVFFLIAPDPLRPLRFQHHATAHAELVCSLLETALHQKPELPGSGEVLTQLARLLAALIAQDLAEERPPSSPLEPLLCRLRRSPHLPWSVAAMAAECGLSTSHFFAVCRRECGVSPAQLLWGIRLELAKTLLSKTDYPIKVVASQCGYELPFSFTRSFTRSMGIPPETYRRKQVASKGGI